MGPQSVEGPAYFTARPLSSSSHIGVRNGAVLMQGGQLARDLLNIEIVAMLNQGLCHLHHLNFCPYSEDLLEQCGKVRSGLLPD